MIALAHAINTVRKSVEATASEASSAAGIETLFEASQHEYYQRLYFYWGWFIGYVPLMAMFVTRISKGRSLRQMIITVSIFAPMATAFWFTIIGGSGLAFELNNPGSVSVAFEGFNLPAALLAITQQLPFGLIVSILFLILTATFVATTGDSMTYTI